MSLILEDRKRDAQDEVVKSRTLLLKGQPKREVHGILAPLGRGWLLIPVSKVHPIWLNGQALETATALAAGDCFGLGVQNTDRSRFEVVQVVSPATQECEPTDLAPAACEVSVRFSRQTVLSKQIDRFIVGCGPSADVILPAETDLLEQHALFLLHAEQWHVFDLSGKKLCRLGATPQTQLSLSNAESVWLQEVEVTLRYRPHDPLDQRQEFASDSPEVSRRTAEAAVPDASSTDTRSAMNSMSSQTSHSYLAPALRDQVGNLMAWLKLALRPLADGSNTRRVSRAHVPPTSGVLLNVAQVEGQLRQQPGNPDTLYRLAGLLGYLELTSARRWILQQICRLNPNDPIALRELAVLYRTLACDASLSLPEREKYIDRARSHIERAATLLPADMETTELHQQIGVEWTLLRLQAC